MNKRSGSLGDEMEAAEVALIEEAARECRTVSDYALWKGIGRQVVQIARRLTQEQRAVFVSSLEKGINYAHEQATTNAPKRLQAALGFSVRVEEGFEDKDE